MICKNIIISAICRECLYHDTSRDFYTPVEIQLSAGGQYLKENRYSIKLDEMTNSNRPITMLSSEHKIRERSHNQYW